MKHLPFRLIYRCFALALVCLNFHPQPALSDDISPDAGAGKPRITRTMTHHQITAFEKGIWAIIPVISDSGNKIIFGLPPEADGQPFRLAAVNFDGSKVAVLDGAVGIGQPDVTADGLRVVYVVGTEIRSAASDGTDRRTLFKSFEGNIDCLRISGDGRIIVFLMSRGMLLKNGDKVVQYVRGVYAINADGSNLRRIAGPEEVARSRGIVADEVGNPNFTLEYRQGSLDVSSDGARVIFGCWAKAQHVIMGCNTDGRNLHTVSEITPGESGHQFIGVALSGDGTTVAYHASRPEELHVVGFDGKSDKLLLKQGPEDQRMGWMFSEPLYMTLDGARITYGGRHFNADGSGSFQLMTTHQEGLLRYLEYEQPAMDAMGRRFVYWPYHPRPYQLATMELNVPWDQLRGAPKISELLVDPPTIPGLVDGVNVVKSRISARVDSNPSPPAVSSTGIWKGIYDAGLTQYGAVGMTDHFDDDKTDVNGDIKASDGIYTSQWLAAYKEAAEGPWNIRVEAQVTGGDKLFHASVVEIGPFPIVPGSAKPATVKGATIDETPPPPPEVKPKPSDGIVTGPTPPPATEIDLTGFWATEDGAKHFIRQIGKSVYWSVEALPRVRNVFMGKIEGDIITGAWVDLPGGEQQNTGTLKLKIVSNDKLTKISDSILYNGSIWTRTKKSTKPGTTEGTGPTVTGPTVTGPATKPQPWQTPAGRALIDKWIVEAMTKVNAVDGKSSFNLRKPYSINKYGLLEGRGIKSVAAPDNFKDFGNDRCCYMWDHWIPNGPDATWAWPEWNKAGVPPLRDYVLKGLAAAEKK